MNFFKTKLKHILTLILLTIICYFCFIYLYNNTTVLTNTNTITNDKLPIIMYHHISKKDKILNKFAITPDQFEKDLIYLKENGYDTISLDELLGYVYNDGELPKKPIMITFDDGYESFYKYIYPLLKKYDAKAVLSVVGSFADMFSNLDDHNIDYSYATWEQLNEMADTKYVEIANHTYDLHKIKNGRKGCGKKDGEDMKNYEKFLKEDILKLQDDILNYTGYEAKAFTYPFGKFSKGTKDILKSFGFSAIFTCSEVLNSIDKNDPSFLYNLGRFNRPHNITSNDFFAKVLKDI